MVEGLLFLATMSACEIGFPLFQEDQEVWLSPKVTGASSHLMYARGGEFRQVHEPMRSRWYGVGVAGGEAGNFKAPS